MAEMFGTSVVASLPVLLLLANSGCPLETTEKSTEDRTTNTVDKLLQNLPPYRPPGQRHSALPSRAEELLDSLVDPIDFDPDSDSEFHLKRRAHGPYFDLHRTRNVTALAGVTTNLVCRVRRLGNHTVSWIRYADTSLLTVGRYTYTTDLRFEAFHSPHTDDWIVRLKNPQPKDTGVYGCQISTTPHRTHKVYLTVHEPATYIVGEPDMFVDIGSMVNLSCVIAYTERPPIRVTWLHNGIEISFRGPRNGVSVITEKAAQTTIHLLMQGANGQDSGVYECIPDNAPPAKIKVHILKAGNQVAGLQTNSARMSSSVPAATFWSFFIYYLLYFTIN